MDPGSAVWSGRGGWREVRVGEVRVVSGRAVWAGRAGSLLSLLAFAHLFTTKCEYVNVMMTPMATPKKVDITTINTCLVFVLLFCLF